MCHTADNGTSSKGQSLRRQSALYELLGPSEVLFNGSGAEIESALDSVSWVKTDREIFEFDRSEIVLQLQNVRRALATGAEEMEMVAAERVFDDAICRDLMAAAGQLEAVVKPLARVLRALQQAQMPPANGRNGDAPNGSPAPTRRRKTRD